MNFSFWRIPSCDIFHKWRYSNTLTDWLEKQGVGRDPDLGFDFANPQLAPSLHFLYHVQFKTSALFLGTEFSGGWYQHTFTLSVFSSLRGKAKPEITWGSHSDRLSGYFQSETYNQEPCASGLCSVRGRWVDHLVCVGQLKVVESSQCSLGSWPTLQKLTGSIPFYRGILSVIAREPVVLSLSFTTATVHWCCTCEDWTRVFLVSPQLFELSVGEVPAVWWWWSPHIQCGRILLQSLLLVSAGSSAKEHCEHVAETALILGGVRSGSRALLVMMIKERLGEVCFEDSGPSSNDSGDL